MAKVGKAHYQRMKKQYDLSVAKYLANAAREKRLITYSDLEEEFGTSARRWGDPLGGIAIRCHENHLPILSVIVVSKGKDTPSEAAVLYQDLGIIGFEAMKQEQRRVFDFDCTRTILGTD